jgi:hypothetical protein
MVKRKLAALLAGAMVLTSLPMVSFARTDNNVSYVPTVKKDDTTFTFDNAPRLIIEEKGSKTDDLTNQTIRLTFEGAEWEGADSGITTSEETVTAFTYKKRTKNTVEITFHGDPIKNDEKFEIPLLTKVTTEGEVKVTINPLNSRVSAGTYVFANGGSGSTKATIADTSDFADELELESIIIDELKANTLPRGTNKKIKLTAPKGFEWATTASSYVTLSGAGAFAGNISERDEVIPTYGKNNDRDYEVLEIYYDNTTTDTSTIGSIILDALKLVATEDADYGDVYVEISGDDITTEKIKVGKYIEYGVVIEVEKADKELISGRYGANDEDDDYKLLKLTIKEGVEDSWWTQRNTTIKFPAGIKVREAKIHEDSDNISISDNQKANGTSDSAQFKLNKDRDTITLSNFTTSGKAKVVLEIWASIEADFEGDITAVVGGPALPEETEVVLGKALKAVNATFKSTDLQIGYKEVAVGDFEITESKAGALQKGKTLKIKPEDMEFSDDFDVKVEVTEGDLQIGDYDIDKNGALVIDIKRESKEASTIKISGAGVYVDRTVAEGSYALEVSGDAFLQNAEDDAKEIDEAVEGFKTDVLEFKDFIKVVTPAPHKGEAAGKAVKVSFTVGSADYTVEGETVTADVAPYIKDGRTMLPVKYVAYALGIDPSNIKWDQATKTVTILGDRVVQVKIGSKDLVVNGAVLTMDTAAEVKDGRTFLPISWVASALNVPYSWDDATKTVTFN